MNYYEHHIGDYDEATAHLTACEDGIYSRLIRKYMATERPLPTDIKVLQRLVRARTRDEKSAVQTVLDEFFELRDDGWHQHRCDETIERYLDKQGKARASAEARWGSKRSQSDGNANASEEDHANAMRTHNYENAESQEKSVTEASTEKNKFGGASAPASKNSMNSTSSHMRTHCDGNANQSPNTKHQAPTNGKNKGAPSALELPEWIPKDAWDAFVAMRKKIKAPLTPDAERLAVGTLEKLMHAGHRPRAVLEQSTLNSWRGLFEIKTPRANGNHESREAFNARENERAKALLFGPEVGDAA